MIPKLRIALVVAALTPLGTAGVAHAELVLLTSGSTLSVQSHRFEGDTIVLQMRGGGEVTCDKSLVEKITADEVPYQEAKPEPVAAPQAPSVAAQEVPAGPYAEIIAAMSQAHGVDPMLVRAVIQVESNYRPTARSHKGAMGLMQLMPSTARQYKVRNPYDPTANIAAGVRHLRSLLDQFRAVDLALAAYNAGEGAVKKFNGVPPYRETRAYVTRILSLAGLR